MVISERTSQNVELAFVISLVYRNTAKVDLQNLGVGLWYLKPLNNISVISWRSVLLVEETRVPGENH